MTEINDLMHHVGRPLIIEVKINDQIYSKWEFSRLT